jgi:NAD(P)-dependent dehydrogenase (short-subunit alcohol dehydrogenase family)
MRLNDKVAVITGAGRGIGLAGAIAFAREGARVVIAEINDQLGTQAAARIHSLGGEATFIKADCSSSTDVQALMAETEKRYGGLHVLYNNASVFLNADKPVADLPEDVWEHVLCTNLRSVFLCCKYGIPRMIASGGGSVINTGSSASVMGIPGCDAYTATKGATMSMTRSMAVEYGPRGVRVNCICPAGVETEMLKESNPDDAAKFDADYFFARAPLRRFGRPEEIANLALFLASDESSYLNGAIVRVDGGITIAPIS